MSRFVKFANSISNIDFNEPSDKTKTIESLRNLLIAENNNYLEKFRHNPSPSKKTDKYIILHSKTFCRKTYQHNGNFTYYKLLRITYRRYNNI